MVATIRGILVLGATALIAGAIFSMTLLWLHGRDAKAVEASIRAQGASGSGASAGDFQSGDVNGDGIVSIVDARIILQVFGGLLNDAPYPDGADPFADGAVDVADAEVILQFVDGHIPLAALPIAPRQLTPSSITPVVSINSVTVGPEETAFVDLSVGGLGDNLGGWAVDIAYDSALVAELTCAPLGGASICNPFFAPGVIRIAGAVGTGMSSKGKYAHLSFRCKGTGSSAVSPSVVLLMDATIGNPQRLQAQASDGKITCSATTPTPPLAGHIVGSVWNDANANGTRDEGEAGLSGWQVTFIAPPSSCCVATVSVDDNGQFSSPSLAPGDYALCLLMQPGWVATAGNGADVNQDYCNSPNPGLALSLHQDSAVDISFGVAHGNAKLTPAIDCPASVEIAVPAECSLQLTNAGDIALSDVASWAARAVCFSDLPPELGGHGRIVGPAFGRPLGIEFLSSDPPWTGRDPWHGEPEWSPLSTSIMQPGGAVRIAMSFRGTVIDRPGDPEMICTGGSGQATFGNYTSPFRVGSYDDEAACHRVMITGAAAGDTNCSGGVDSIDAALALQYSAGLTSDLACASSADVNYDGSVDSLDALLILQFVAGLIPQL